MNGPAQRVYREPSATTFWTAWARPRQTYMLIGMRLVLSSAKVFLRHLGLDVQFTKNTLAAARKRVLAAKRIGIVVDVGANRGQYVDEL